MSSTDLSPAEQSFVTAYAEAVTGFLQGLDPHGIWYRPIEGQFVAGEVEPGTVPSDCDWWVSDGWQELLGDLGVVVNPAAPGYSADALHDAIVTRLSGLPVLRIIVASAIQNFTDSTLPT